MLTNIGLYNVAKLKGIYCAECECLLGICLSDFTLSTSYDILCFLCADSLVSVADTLGFISPNGWAGCIEDLPSQQDLTNLIISDKNMATVWHDTIKEWSKDMRDEHQVEKVRKLQNE